VETILYKILVVKKHATILLSLIESRQTLHWKQSQNTFWSLCYIFHHYLNILLTSNSLFLKSTFCVLIHSCTINLHLSCLQKCSDVNTSYTLCCVQVLCKLVTSLCASVKMGSCWTMPCHDSNYIWQKFVQINNTKFYNGCSVDSEMKYSVGANIWLSYVMLILGIYAHYA